jgi:hypothetical protein
MNKRLLITENVVVVVAEVEAAAVVVVVVVVAVVVKGTTNPLQAWTGPWGARRLRFPDFLEILHMKVVRLSSAHTSRRYSFVTG